MIERVCSTSELYVFPRARGRSPDRGHFDRNRLTDAEEPRVTLRFMCWRCIEGGAVSSRSVWVWCRRIYQIRGPLYTVSGTANNAKHDSIIICASFYSK
ncbi:hypothetical protein GWI33_017786 [Rhynchophorus ferrugineus]|uniref:Uncharacterized protein n=1 Tax=Rhynchophorus ferrugineus TaxID=354439 RepID=A0A834HVB8_RHYFE|nr:hypothetical protein GWI33_017786 [Rhynchophorus ferrugineus]